MTREIEVVFLEHLARDPRASAWNAVQLTEVDVLGALRRRAPKLRPSVDEVLAAAQASPALTCRSAPPTVVDGQLSRHVLLCHPRHLPGASARSGQADFARLARDLNAAGRQPVALLSQAELRLREGTGTLTLRNGGYGTDADLHVTGVTRPDWLVATVNGRHVELRANPAYNGYYRGPVVVQTSAGEATCTVVSHQWRCPPVKSDPVDWRSLVTRHAHLDEEVVRHAVEQHLSAAGYRPLTGGFFALGSQEAGAHGTAEVHVTTTWRVTAKQLREARLPAQGHAPLVRLYSPDGTDRYDVPFDGEALHGEALEELFLMWDVKVGRELHLTPYRGHYRFEVHRPGTWLNAKADEYGIVGTLAALHRTPHFWDQLEEWLADAPVRVLLHGPEAGLLAETRRRFPKRLTVRLTDRPVGEDRLYFIKAGELVEARGLPGGQLLKGGSWPAALWEEAAPRKAAVVSPTLPPPAPAPARTVAGGLEPYAVWSGTVAHPLEGRSDKVVQSVKEILHVEGPMVGHHLYARYGEALSAQKGRAGLSPMALKRALNPVLYHAAQQGELLAEDEFGSGGQIGLVYRLPGQTVRPRLKGDRNLDRIPRSELRAVAATASPDLPETEQVAWVLEQFGFGRFLTGGPEQVRPLLLQRTAVGPAAPQRRRAR
nr:hypothetical protein [Deinococcus sp. HSC-46F16]